MSRRQVVLTRGVSKNVVPHLRGSRDSVVFCSRQLIGLSCIKGLFGKTENGTKLVGAPNEQNCGFTNAWRSRLFVPRMTRRSTAEQDRRIRLRGGPHVAGPPAPSALLKAPSCGPPLRHADTPPRCAAYW